MVLPILLVFSKNIFFVSLIFLYVPVFNLVDFCSFCFTYLFLDWYFVAASRLFLDMASRYYSLVVVHKLLFRVASLVAGHRLQHAWASAAAARGLRSYGPWAWLPPGHVESSWTRDQTHGHCTGHLL